MATVARVIHCELGSLKQSSVPAPKRGPPPVSVPKNTPEMGGTRIVLQPRLCTLRSYSSDRFGVLKTRRNGQDGVSPFFEILSEYIESSKKSHDFETVSGRLAMMVFAATISMEVVTGNSVFRKMDLQGIAEASGICLGAITCAAIFAWFTSARNRVDKMFIVGCNTFIDNLIDQIVDGLFYESEFGDWSDDI